MKIIFLISFGLDGFFVELEKIALRPFCTKYNVVCVIDYVNLSRDGC